MTKPTTAEERAGWSGKFTGMLSRGVLVMRISLLLAEVERLTQERDGALRGHKTDHEAYAALKAKLEQAGGLLRYWVELYGDKNSAITGNTKHFLEETKP